MSLPLSGKIALITGQNIYMKTKSFEVIYLKTNYRRWKWNRQSRLSFIE